jgi:DNA-binding MarR family transcriptional regulator
MGESSIEDCAESGIVEWNKNRGFGESWGQFYRAFKRINELAERDLKNAGQVTLPLLEIMYHIYLAPGGRMRLLDIAHKLVTSPSSVTRSMDKLVEMGFVTRRESKTDRRETLASLTAKGKANLESGMLILSRSRSTHFEPAFEDEDLVGFLRILQRLTGRSPAPVGEP